MSQPVKDSFLDLEWHRQLLEANIEKLRRALHHWQAWEAEYERLREEIRANQPFPTPEQLISISKAYEGELITKVEIDDILGVKTARSAEQVANILERRIDYVRQNVQTIRKQLKAAERKLAAATVISTPDARNDEGLLLMEIVEELDEDGNVISGRILTPGSARDQLLEVLEKAGVKDLPGLEQMQEPTREERTEDSKVQKIKSQSTLESTPSDTPKKSVKFTEDTKAGPEVKKSKTTQRVEIMNLVRQKEAAPAESPIIPANESPEDAALRREMLEYGMSEIGPIVAELDLEEGSDFTDGEYDDEDVSGMEDGDDDEGDEDEHGRFTGRIVDNELRQKMMELEEKLGFRKRENAKPETTVGVVDEGIWRIRIKREGECSPTKVKIDGKKVVRFTEGLDVSPSPDAAPPSKAAKSPPAPKKSPISDIVERAFPERELLASNAAPLPKMSRFKSARSAEAPTPVSTTSPPHSVTTTLPSNTRNTPTPPSGMPLAAVLVERPTPTLPPLEPDELNPALVKQEVATEYYRVRNRLISRQGGFVKDKEEEERRTGRVEYEEEEGGPKRVSRFKAARLARS